MADSDVQVKIGGDASQLVASIEIAKAQLAQLQSQMRAMANDAIASGRAADTGLRQQLGALAGTAGAVKGQLGEFESALTSVDAAASHGTGISFYAREAHALMDELTSGRVRQAEGTFSNLALTFAMAHTAMVPLIAGAIAMAAAIGYAAYEAVAFKNAVQGLQAQAAIDQFNLTAKAANDLASAVATAADVSYSDAEKFAKPFLALGPGGDTVAKIASQYLPLYIRSGQDAAKAGEEMAAVFLKWNTTGLEFINHTVGMSNGTRAQAAAMVQAGDQAGVYGIILQAMGQRLDGASSSLAANKAQTESWNEAISNAAAAEAGLDTSMETAAAGAERAAAAVETHRRAIQGLRSEADKQFSDSKLIDQQQTAASDKITDKTNTEQTKIRELTGELAQQEAQLAKLNATASAPAATPASSEKIKAAQADLYNLQAQLELVKNAYNQIDLSQAGAFRDPGTQALIAKEQELGLAVRDAKVNLDKLMGGTPSVATQDAAARLTLSIATIKDQLRQAQERAAGGLIPTTAFEKAQEDIKNFENSQAAKGPVSKKLTYEIEILRKEGAGVPGSTKEGQQFADEIAVKEKAADAARVAEANKTDDTLAARTKQTANQEVATELAKYTRIAAMSGMGSPEELAARQQLNEKLKGLDEQHIADAADAINREIAGVKNGVEQKLKSYQDDVKNHRLTAQEGAEDTARDLQQEKAQLDVLYSQKAALYANDVAEQRKVGDAKIAAERQTDDQVAASNRQAADAYQKTWQSAADEVESAFNSQIRGLLEGTETWGQAAKKVLEDFVVKAIESFEKFAVNAVLQYAVVNQAAGASGAVQTAANQSASSGGLMGLFASFFAGGKGGAAGVAGAAGGVTNAATTAAQTANTAALTANTAALTGNTGVTTAHSAVVGTQTAATTGQTVATGANTVTTGGNTVTTAAGTVGVTGNTVATGANSAELTTGVGEWIANTVATSANTVATDAASFGKLFGFAEGTPQVKQTGIAMIHEGEAIIPAHLNPFTRASSLALNDVRAFAQQPQLSMISRSELYGASPGNDNSGSGGGLPEVSDGGSAASASDAPSGPNVSIHPAVHIHNNNVDSASVSQFYRQHQREMMKSVESAVRNGAHLGLKGLRF